MLEEKLDKIEAEEEYILESEGQLVGSMVGRRRILTTRAVGEAWERFSRDRKEVVKKSFRILGLALPINGSCDGEISITGIDSTYLREGLRDWQEGVVVASKEDSVELANSDDERDAFYVED